MTGSRFSEKNSIVPTGPESFESQLRLNERIWNGFRQIEIALLGAHSLADLVEILGRGIPSLFPNVERVTLACVDPELELTRLFEKTEKVSRLPPFVAVSADTLNRLFVPPYRPRLGRLEDDIRQELFPAGSAGLGSMALAPLVLRGELIGCLNQASRDAAHFGPDAGTDLLEHLAAVTAMCIDNAVIRERLKIDGLTDPLTGLYNRRFFERRMREEVERWSRRRGAALACMLVDVDHFKQINDRYGHHAGDCVLQGLVKLFGRVLRGSDVLARFGGEEFVLLLPETGRVQGAGIAERLRALVESTPLSTDKAASLSATVSIGLAALEAGTPGLVGDLSLSAGGHDTDPAAWLLRSADTMLYRAKQAGRNRVVCFQGYGP